MMGKAWDIWEMRCVIPAANQLIFGIRPMITVGNDFDAVARSKVQVL
jgi:hypothetical protein